MFFPLWTPDSIIFYLDGLPVAKTYRDTNRYLDPMRMLIENSLPATNYCQGPINSSTQIPVTYEIDYVKVWQPELDCDTIKNYLTGTESIYKSKHYQRVTFGGTNGNFSFNNNVGIARGCDFIEINENSEFGSSNTTFTFDVYPCWTRLPSVNLTVISHTPSTSYILKIMNNAKQKD